VSEPEALQGTIESRLREVDPEVELIALQRPAAETLRLYIDHPAGVDLALCERVTMRLRDLLERWSLEVSSPGADRPLTKPEHFRRFLGRRVRVRTREAIEGQRSFTGTLTAADEGTLSLDAGSGPVTIPLAGVRRSNLVPELSGAPSAPGPDGERDRGWVEV
jgi:ribosome maturation factor RimP